MKLYLDTETRSSAKLPKTGIMRYVSSPDFKVLLCTWAINDGAPRVWCPLYDPMPKRLYNTLRDENAIVVIANSAFDRRVIEHSKAFGCLKLRTERIVDTMIQALSHNLPGSLGDQSKLFGLGSEGKFDGRQLIRLFCMPNKDGTFNDPKDFPEQWEDFVSYAKQDIVAMRVVHKRIPRMNYPRQEHDLWCLDQRIADRGIPVDMELAIAGVKEQKAEKKRLNDKAASITEGKVTAATQRDRLIQYMGSKYGYEIPDLRAATVARWLERYNLPADLRALLEVRSQSSLTSAKKYSAIVDRQVDGKIYDTLQFLGASTTGRDCLAEGTLVVTDTGAKPIEKVSENDFLWDGIQWVSHEGVEFSGRKLVIFKDGVNATPEHKVFLKDGNWVLLGELGDRSIWRSLPDHITPQVAEGREGLANTYDVIEAGPNNRFALANGCIVSNSGRGFQPQNLMRPTRWRGLENEELDQAIEQDIKLIKSGAASIVDENVMDLLGNCVRSVIQAPKGFKIVDADLSNIEGRALVWLAGEEWKVQFFHDFDAGEVPFDNYEMAYAKAMNVKPETVDKYKRAIGKVMELALGYGGGVGAFINFANVYNLDINALADAVWEVSDLYDMKECADKHKWAEENGYSAGMNEHCYAACEHLKRQWRQAHPRTVSMWGALEGAYRNCIKHEGTPFSVGDKLTFKRKGQWMFVKLPSGRFLTYLQPRIEKDGSLTYVGRDSYSKKIQRIGIYSGSLAENVTSGTARDVLLKRMPDVEDAGYAIVTRVHDELVTVAPDADEFNAKHLAGIMTQPYPWSKGLPLAADGFEARRFRK